MTSFIAKKIFKESLSNKFGAEDPFFETVPATRLGGKPKKRRKANPPGLSEHDGHILTKVKRRAYRLDMSLWNCCGIRFGWSSVIGIVPGFGDVLDMMMALMVFRTCAEVEGGLPPAIKTRMMVNIILDFAVGLVPILGDIADALFRANTRNAAILEQHLREKGKKSLKDGGAPLPIDPSDPQEYDRQEDDSSGHVYTQPLSQERMSGAKQAPSRGKDSARRARNELRDMEEGVVSHQSRSGSKNKSSYKSKEGRSSRRGR